MRTHPTDNLVRSVPAAATIRGDAGEAGILYGEFARFNELTEIDSVWEGHFLERIAPGAFDQTVADDLHRVKVLFDHGADPSLGNKPLGPIRSVEATDTGMAYEVELIETDYNRDFVIPAARAGLLGASFRMQVVDEEWDDAERSSDDNPDRLPTRTIHRVKLFEFGPVSFPAYEGASAGLRSTGSDRFLQQMLDPEFVAAFAARTNGHVAAKILEDAKAANGAGALDEATTPTGTANGLPEEPRTGRSAANARLALLNLGR